MNSNCLLLKHWTQNSCLIHICASANIGRWTYHWCTPINGVAQWPATEYDTILPPAFKQGPSRPKKLRRREPEEEGNPTKLRRTHTRQKCGRCHEVGHNSRRCTLPPPVPEEVPPAPQPPPGPQPPQAPNVPQDPQPQQVPNAPQEPQPPQAPEAPQPTSTTVAAPPRRKYKKRSGSCSQPPPISDKNATPDGSCSQPQPTDKGKKARKSNTRKGEKARSVAGKQVEDEGRSGTPSSGEARSAAPSAPQAIPTAPSAPQPRSATPSAPRPTSVAEPHIPPWAQKMTVG